MKELTAIETLLKALKAYEIPDCYPYAPECAECQLHQLYGLLAWYKDVLENE